MSAKNTDIVLRQCFLLIPVQILFFGGAKKKMFFFLCMLTRRLRNAKKQRYGNDRLGYKSEHTYTKFEEIMTSISASVVDYMEDGTDAKYSEIIDLTDFTIWKAVSPPLRPFDCTPKEGEYEGYVMSLCKCRSTLLRHEVRATEDTLQKWVSVRKSQFEDSGYGLFTEKSFKIGDIITVFVGVLSPSSSRHGDRFISFKKNNGQIVHINTMKNDAQRLYFGAHYANDPCFGMSAEAIAKISSARNVQGYNAVINDNMCIVATKFIRKNVEVRLMYRPIVRG